MHAVIALQKGLKLSWIIYKETRDSKADGMHTAA